MIKKSQKQILLGFLILSIFTSVFGSISDAFALAPNAPTGLTATAVSTTQINLSWTASSLTNNISATGGTITTSGGRTIHTFTSSGTYTVNSGSGNIQALVIAGGGGGSQGGGGAGGFRYDSSHSVTAGAYTITVGAGGSSGSGSVVGGNGGNSVFDTITSTGGGGGGSQITTTGSNGGSGGGGGSISSGSGTTSGGTGTAGQGNNGGGNGGFTANPFPSGGGGGANAVGGTASSSTANGPGGNGLANSISGSSVTYAGGGGGATCGTSAGTGAGGSGGGGAGNSNGNGASGSTNTGGGGGGGDTCNSSIGGLGGSGIVILSEVTPDPAVTGYKIERSPDGSTWSTIVANTGSTATTYSNTGLTPHTTYYYRVSGINSDGTSSPSSTASTITLGHVPPAPTLNSVTQISPSSLNITWSSSVGATWYFENRTSPAGGTLVNVVNTTSLFHLDTGLTAGTQYQYGIQAGNGTGYSTVSNKLSKYTVNVAPTSLTTSLITNSKIRVGWTNPSGNFSGFKVEYQIIGAGGWTTAISNTNNSTNRYDVTGLVGNTEYLFRVSTNYATGSSDAGTSSPSSTTQKYTLPNSPTLLTASQNKALTAHLAWIAPTDNGTVSGYKIEQSVDGVNWSIKIANTGNATIKANLTETSGGKYQFRVSTIKYGGTSSPSNTASITLYGSIFITARKADNVTIIQGSIYQSNSSSLNNIFPLTSGTTAAINGLTGFQNFSAKNAATLFVVKKQYNVNATTLANLIMVTNDFIVNCPYTVSGSDIELFTNETDGHRISSFSSPVCYANNTIKWNVHFTANRNNPNTFSTSVRLEVLNNTYSINPTLLTANGTTIGTSFSLPWIISNPITVGTGFQNRTILFSTNLALNPAYIPNNYTSGNLTVTGSNLVIQPIQITSTQPNASATVVTFTYPNTYNLTVAANYQMENQTHIFTNLPTSIVDAAHVSSSITFKNSSNDIIKLTARDLKSNTNANYSLSQTGSSIPLIQQIINFRNGTYGTHGQFGYIDLVTLLVLIFSMVGMNRVNETLGLVFNIIIIGSLAYFGILTWPTIMVPAIAMIALVTVGSTKKLPWS